MSETDHVMLNGWQVLRIFAGGVTVLGPLGCRYIGKGSPEWRCAFGDADQLPLTLEQRGLAARLRLFHGADGQPIQTPAETQSTPSALLAPTGP